MSVIQIPTHITPIYNNIHTNIRHTNAYNKPIVTHPNDAFLHICGKDTLLTHDDVYILVYYLHYNICSCV